MAEYYPLISRAVAGLRTARPEARQAIYDRAKQALVGQLRSMEPPVPEDAIERETTALDEAVARVESELAANGPAPPPTRPAPPELRADSKGPAPAVSITPPVAAKLPVPPRPAPRAEPPRLPPRPKLPPLRPSAPGAPPEAGPGVTGGTADALKAPPSDAPELATATGPAFPSAPTLQVADPDEPSTRPLRPEGRMPLDDLDAPLVREFDPARARDDMSRPAAPRPVERRRPNLGVWIVAFAALAAVVVIAFTAWRLRDNPQDLARVPVPVKAPEPTPGKLVERADDTTDTTDTTATAPTTPSPAAASSVAAAAVTAASPSAATSPAPAPAIPVAQKAAILVDAPDDPQKVKTYVGTALWRTETVSQGQDQPIGTAVRADIDIPDAKIQMTMQIRRNTEPQFPASHTIDIKFTVQSESPLGGVKQINVPQLRRPDMPTGDPLSGIPVTITDNYFLVGLTRGAPEGRNLDLLGTNGWIDIPLLLGNGKASKITFEKGGQGDKVVADVLQAWKASPN